MSEPKIIAECKECQAWYEDNGPCDEGKPGLSPHRKPAGHDVRPVEVKRE